MGSKSTAEIVIMVSEISSLLLLATEVLARQLNLAGDAEAVTPELVKALDDRLAEVKSRKEALRQSLQALGYEV